LTCTRTGASPSFLTRYRVPPSQPGYLRLDVVRYPRVPLRPPPSRSGLFAPYLPGRRQPRPLHYPGSGRWCQRPRQRWVWWREIAYFGDVCVYEKHTHKHTHTQTHTHRHTHKHTHTHTYIHTHRHIHTRTEFFCRCGARSRRGSTTLRMSPPSSSRYVRADVCVCECVCVCVRVCVCVLCAPILLAVTTLLMPSLGPGSRHAL
jgi:hypothetical protein